MIDFIDVDSSNVASVGWASDELYVKFKNNSVYKYFSVDEGLFEELLASSSTGKFLNERIKPSFSFERLA